MSTCPWKRKPRLPSKPSCSPNWFSILSGSTTRTIGIDAFYQMVQLACFIFGTISKTHPSMNGHCPCSKPNWENSTVPLGLHGDSEPTVGCGKVWTKPLQAYSWICLISRGSAQQRSVFIWGVPSHLFGVELWVLLSLCLFYRITCLCL